MEESESIKESLNALNLTLERLGFNNAMLREGPGAVEGLTMAIKDIGQTIADSVDALAQAIDNGRNDGDWVVSVSDDGRNYAG